MFGSICQLVLSLWPRFKGEMPSTAVTVATLCAAYDNITYLLWIFMLSQLSSQAGGTLKARWDGQNERIALFIKLVMILFYE